MNSITRRKLNALNQRFYRERANEFGATRQHEWPGWRRTLGLLNQPQNEVPIRILDIGCGNGRFADFLLKSHSIGNIEYTGVDQSPELLAMAQKKCAASEGSSLSWLECDATSSDLKNHLPANRYDLVVAFGLLHHIPSLEHRKKMMKPLANSLCAHGVLAFTIWRFEKSERFTEKIISWQDYNQDSVEKIDLNELEHGDYLMSFGDTSRVARYCHAGGDSEAKALTESLGLERIDQFSADGKTNNLNDYHVFVKSGVSPK